MIRSFKQPKPKTCPCGIKFTPMNSLQKYHDKSCELKYKTGNVNGVDLINVALPVLYSMATGAFQAARRKVLPPKCYTCGRESGMMHCGHAFKKEIYRGVIFDEDNTRVQCDFCNVGLGGNTETFLNSLKAELGKLKFQLLCERAASSHDYIWNRIELIEIFNKYKA